MEKQAEDYKENMNSFKTLPRPLWLIKTYLNILGIIHHTYSIKKTRSHVKLSKVLILWSIFLKILVISCLLMTDYIYCINGLKYNFDIQNIMFCLTIVLCSLTPILINLLVSLKSRDTLKLIKSLINKKFYYNKNEYSKPRKYDLHSLLYIAIMIFVLVNCLIAFKNVFLGITVSQIYNYIAALILLIRTLFHYLKTIIDVENSKLDFITSEKSIERHIITWNATKFCEINRNLVKVRKTLLEKLLIETKYVPLYYSN